MILCIMGLLDQQFPGKNIFPGRRPDRFAEAERNHYEATPVSNKCGTRTGVELSKSESPLAGYNFGQFELLWHLLRRLSTK